MKFHLLKIVELNKGVFSNLLRQIGLMHAFDKLRFYYSKWQNASSNRFFLEQNPAIDLPPDYLMYESFRLDYEKYYAKSRSTAEYIYSTVSKHAKIKEFNVLDWGCGPGRVIRHMPVVMNAGCRFYGTDANKKSITWCLEHLPGISFNHNSLEPELPYEDDFFDLIYGISIFTHLSEEAHWSWAKELRRILKPGGLMYITTQGEAFRNIMTPGERERFDQGRFITRGNVREGHRTYSAFHPPSFVRKLFGGMEILEHQDDRKGHSKWIPQDVWLVRK